MILKQPRTVFPLANSLFVVRRFIAWVASKTNHVRKFDMVKLKPERARKLWGLPENPDDPEKPSDPEVLQRRPCHEKGAKWLAKWSLPLQGIFALIGIVIVLLPSIWIGWRKIIEAIPIARFIFHEFSTLRGWALVLLAIILLPKFILDWMPNSCPGGWNPRKQRFFPTPALVVELELYPRTRREEFVFWVSVFLATIGTTYPLFLIGGISLFIRIKVG